MKKSISISLHGQIFHIEEDAYTELKKYLDSIQKYFAAQEDGQEIIHDIENSIAEHFTAILSPAKKVINGSDVESLIETMGDIKDFQNFDEGKTPPEVIVTGPKKLYRDTENKLIAGVASGVANYFGIDPIITRIGFVTFPILNIITNGFIAQGSGLKSILSFLSILSFTLYFLLWFIVPKAKTTADKMKMQGKEVTLTNLAEQVHKEEKISKTESKNFSGNFFNFLREITQMLAKTFQGFFIIVIKFIGLSFIIASILTVLMLSLQFFLLLFANLLNIETDIPVFELVGAQNFYLLLTSIYIGIIVPMLFLLFLGTTLFKLKNTFKLNVTAVLLSVWIISTTFGFVLFFKEMPTLQTKVNAIANQERIIKIEPFSEIEIRENLRVNIQQGEEFKMVVKGFEKRIQDVSAQKEGNRLIVSQQNREDFFCFFCMDEAPQINITVPELQKIKIINSARVTMKNFSGKELAIEMSHLSFLDLNGKFETINVKMENQPRLFLSGEAQALKADISDMSQFDALKLQLIQADILVKNGSFIVLNASKDINGELRHQGTLFYVNQPNLNVKTLENSTIERLAEPETFEEISDDFRMMNNSFQDIKKTMMLEIP